METRRFVDIVHRRWAQGRPSDHLFGTSNIAKLACLSRAISLVSFLVFEKAAAWSSPEFCGFLSWLTVRRVFRTSTRAIIEGATLFFF